MSHFYSPAQRTWGLSCCPKKESTPLGPQVVYLWHFDIVISVLLVIRPLSSNFRWFKTQTILFVGSIRMSGVGIFPSLVAWISLFRSEFPKFLAHDCYWRPCLGFRISNHFSNHLIRGISKPCTNISGWNLYHILKTSPAKDRKMNRSRIFYPISV